MTISQAAQKYGIPRSRIARSITRGWLNTEKEKGKHVFPEQVIEAALTRRRDLARKDRTITIRERFNLCICSKHTESFSTRGGADEFEDLFARSQSAQADPSLVPID